MNSSSIDPVLASHSAFRRVLIIDDNSFFSFCLRTLIDRDPELRVCDVAANEADLRARIERYQPDLLVIDLSVGAAGGFELARGLRLDGVNQPILFVSTGAAVPRHQLSRLGNVAFTFKGGNPSQLIARIKTMLAAALVRPAARPDPVAAIA